MNKRSTKHALIMSVISIVLCVSMLVGTTFAWFTDSITSAGNVIKAGTLDIGMYWTDGTKDVPPDKEGWADASNSSIFCYDKWEPGFTEIRHLKISNEGTLAFRYQLNVIADGEVTALANVIDVYFVDPATKIDSREKLEEKYRLGTLAEVLAGLGDTTEGTLLAGENKIVTIALKMHDYVSNEYQGMSIGSDFTIQLLATQYTYENDSFGSDYDKEAFNYNVVVRTDEELEYAVQIKSNIIIAIDGDLTYDIDTASKALFLNGKTLIGWNGNDSITFTGSLSDSSVSSLSLRDLTVSPTNLNFTDLNAKRVRFEGGLGLDGISKFTDCRFKSTETGEYAISVNGGRTVLTDCFISGTGAIMINEANGSNVKSVTVDNCIFGGVSEKPGVVIGSVDPDTSVLIKDSFFVTTQTGTDGLYTYESATDVSTFNLSCDTSNTIIPDAIIVASGEEYRAATRGANVVIFEDILYDNDDPKKQLNPLLEDSIHFYGFGATVTLKGADPEAGNHGYFSFIPPKGKDAIVQDLTVTGTGYVGLGDYKLGAGGNHVASNLVIKDMVSPLENWNANDCIGIAFSTYGKNTTLNNCIMTGTTSMFEGVIPYDAGFPNSTSSTINGGIYGAIRLWEAGKLTVNGAKIEKIDSRACKTKAGKVYGKLTLKAGTHVGTIRLIPDNSFLPCLEIEEGATVDTIIYQGVSYTQEEWLAKQI